MSGLRIPECGLKKDKSRAVLNPQPEILIEKGGNNVRVRSINQTFRSVLRARRRGSPLSAPSSPDEEESGR
jgi:hypothetical protein